MTYSNLYQTPQAVTELGRTLFLELPLYESKQPHRPIYIHQDLFAQYFYKETVWIRQAEFIKNLFSVTIDVHQSSGKQVGLAYVDRQGEDAYGCSLVGNKGSGRAYYVGDCFNIKGEKTPLACSEHEFYRTGVLKTGSAIWSTLIANTYEAELTWRVSPVLAILAIDDQHCKIIRMNIQGSLNKVTHLFYQPYALSKHELLTAAKQFACLEAEKFIRRILHGAWSAGNISLKGHLLDYDSVCAVKGRQAQYCYTDKYVNNYFGFEIVGQLLTLKDILSRPEINKSNVSFYQLKKAFFQQYHQEIQKGILYLMGFEDPAQIIDLVEKPLKKLSRQFILLSRYTFYQNKMSLHANSACALVFHLFDFSALFRLYPLLKIYTRYTENNALNTLIYSHRQSDIMAYAIEHAYDTKDLPPSVKTRFAKYLLPWPTDLGSLTQRAREFVTAYDTIFDHIQEQKKYSLDKIAARAYCINEDRLYLLSLFSVEQQLTHWQHMLPSKKINAYIHRLITASKRTVTNEHAHTGMRLFLEGYLYLNLNQQGMYQIIIHLDNDDCQFRPCSNAWQIMFQGHWVDGHETLFQDHIEIKTNELPTSQLLENASRDSIFLLNTFHLYQDGKKIELNDICFSGHKEDYYL